MSNVKCSIVHLAYRHHRLSSPDPPLTLLTMASASSTAALLLRARQQTATSALLRHSRAPFAAKFSSSSRVNALPAGPPPQGYRVPKTRRWDDKGGLSALDKAGNLFLMTEMMRGVWVVLEQFFRAP